VHETVRRTFHTDDTIVAISTPLGHSGIGVVRISGTEAIQIARRFVQPAILDVEYQHRTAMGARWVDAQGELVDQVIVTVFRAPQSYTGEDVVEVSGHGNPFSLR
jgi:tRNA modification GTPase